MKRRSPKPRSGLTAPRRREGKNEDGIETEVRESHGVERKEGQEAESSKRGRRERKEMKREEGKIVRIKLRRKRSEGNEGRNRKESS